MIEDPDVQILLGDASSVLRGLESESVHAIVTSPPFWNLRDYGVDGQIGLEATPEEWVERLVDVFREARRVLRRDGTFWLEVGDTYADRANVRRDVSEINKRDVVPPKINSIANGRKAKDLVGAPWMLAFALRADGWWLRQENIWARPNPQPESAEDRPTRAHTQVFLLAKSERYFYDRLAIATPAANDPRAGGRQAHAHRGRAAEDPDGRRGRLNGAYLSDLANARSVWTITTESSPVKHFATMARRVASTCIAAGTSEHGACAECGAPWRRLVEVENPHPGSSHNHADDLGKGGAQVRSDGKAAGSIMRERSQGIVRRMVGWGPTCACEAAGVEPCVVLDPFMGSGTTALVARTMGRRAIGVELSPEYLELAREKLAQQSLFGGGA